MAKISSTEKAQRTLAQQSRYVFRCSLFGSSYGRGLLLNSLAFLLCNFSFVHGDAQSWSQCMSANVSSYWLYEYRLYSVEAFFCRLPSGEECYTHFWKTVLLIFSDADICLSVRNRNEAASLQIKVL